MSALDRIVAAIHEHQHAGLHIRPAGDWPDTWCERCGSPDSDGEGLVTMIDPATNGTARVHEECGDALGWVLTPGCDGAPDLCGADAGQPYAPACPSLAADLDTGHAGPRTGHAARAGGPAVTGRERVSEHVDGGRRYRVRESSDGAVTVERREHDGWWSTFVIMVAAVVPIAWYTVRPWTTCPCCRGERTHRHPQTRRFVRHCTACAGWGTVERPGRRTLRRLTGGRVFPRSPERPIDGQAFAGNAPLAGGGRRPRRARTGHTSTQPERPGTRRR